jgi:hypothetical protein
MRIIGLDADVFTINGEDKLAALSNIDFRFTQEFVDVSGIAERDEVYRLGGRATEITATCRIHNEPAFYDIAQNGDEVYVVFKWDAGGTQHGFSLYAYVGNVSVRFGGRNEAAAEEITIRPSRAGTITYS